MFPEEPKTHPPTPTPTAEPKAALNAALGCLGVPLAFTAEATYALAQLEAGLIPHCTFLHPTRSDGTIYLLGEAADARFFGLVHLHHSDGPFPSPWAALMYFVAVHHGSTSLLDPPVQLL